MEPPTVEQLTVLLADACSIEDEARENARKATSKYITLLEKAHREAQREADLYHEVMGLLRRTKMDHGTCEPPERNACTACAAQRELDRLLGEYRGAPVSLQGGS